MRVLADTSVWVSHFRSADAELSRMLDNDQVLIHPLILMELACGTPPAPRQRTLALLRQLQCAREASVHEILDFIEREHLYGHGCGAVDISLLASTLITPETKLWTLDKRLNRLAQRLGCHWPTAYP
ncbi:MAG: type II toxin-antitoxin system VapC family toxin [Lautropia sp.]|nr:type II toxin-antitoxin system VapC family toxin [Lautropia sp.]